MSLTPGLHDVGAIVLTGGTAVRMGGIDKAGLEIGGRTLLEHTLAALEGIGEVVVVGPDVPTSRPVTWRREDPPSGGPAAALAAGLTGFAVAPRLVVVLAVDMPRVEVRTVQRLVTAATDGADGSILVDADGRRQFLCAAYDVSALRACAPPESHGASLREWVGALELVEVPAVGREADDIDTWEALRDLADDPPGPQPDRG